MLSTNCERSNVTLGMPRSKKSVSIPMLSANCKRSNVPPHMPRTKKSANNAMLSANCERRNVPPGRNILVTLLGLRRWMHKSHA